MKLTFAVLGLAWNLALAATATEPQRTPPGRRSEEALGAPDLYRRVSPSVVSIVVSGRDGKPQKAGSGVVIDTAGHVLTNYHVVEGGSFFDVRVASQGGRFRSFVARPAACAPDQDLAEIELAAPTGLRSAKTASGQPEVGSRVYAVGSPLQLEGTLTEGVVSQVRDLDEQKLIQTTAAISPGSSGGGLFNSRAELVGITTMSLSGGQNLNFAISLAGLRALVPCNEFPVLVGNQDSTPEPTPVPTPTPCLPKLQLRQQGSIDIVESPAYTAVTGHMTVRVRGIVDNVGCGSASFVQVRATAYIKPDEYIASKAAFVDRREVPPNGSSDYEVLIPVSTTPWLDRAANKGWYATVEILESGH